MAGRPTESALPPTTLARYSRWVARTPSIRASDLDREHIAERLHRATVEGRLRTEELEERLEAAYAARTYGELDVLVCDLPPLPPARVATPATTAKPASKPDRVPAWAGLAAVLTLFTLLSVGAVMGGHTSTAATFNGRPYQPPPATALTPAQQQLYAHRFLENAHAAAIAGVAVLGLLVIASFAVAGGWLALRARSGRRL